MKPQNAAFGSYLYRVLIIASIAVLYYSSQYRGIAWYLFLSMHIFLIICQIKIKRIINTFELSGDRIALILSKPIEKYPQHEIKFLTWSKISELLSMAIVPMTFYYLYLLIH